MIVVSIRAKRHDLRDWPAPVAHDDLLAFADLPQILGQLVFQFRNVGATHVTFNMAIRSSWLG